MDTLLVILIVLIPLFIVGVAVFQNYRWSKYTKAMNAEARTRILNGGH